jgi:hypothetical protein
MRGRLHKIFLFAGTLMSLLNLPAMPANAGAPPPLAPLPSDLRKTRTIPLRGRNAIVKTHEMNGSADRLAGSLYVLHIFASTADRPWTSEDKNHMFQLQQAAYSWLQQSALQAGQQLSIKEGVYGLQADITVAQLPGTNGEYSVDVPDLAVNNLLHAVGWPDAVSCYNWIREHEGCENVIVIVWPNCNGRSFARPYEAGYSPDYFVESTVIFPRFADGQEECAATIAHETLHLFGAWDLYKCYLTTDTQAQEAERLYPNDIMRRVAYSFDGLTIGPLTAWRIGWNDRPENYFEWFHPRGDKAVVLRTLAAMARNGELDSDAARSARSAIAKGGPLDSALTRKALLKLARGGEKVPFLEGEMLRKGKVQR